MQPQQIDRLMERANQAVELAREAARIEVRAALYSAEFCDHIRALIRDEQTENRPAESRQSMAFEIRFLRREIEALTKQLKTISTSEDVE
jgi:hypothetical protein